MNYQNSRLLFCQLGLILSVFILSCSPKSSTEPDKITASDTVKTVYEIDPRNFGEEEIKLSDIGDNIEYIPLSNKIRIGQLAVFKMTSNAIYIVSAGTGADNSSVLIKYDEQGKNPLQIGQVGRGPREYVSARIFTVDEKKGKIYIKGRNRTILVFESNGEYFRQFKYPDELENIMYMETIGNDYLFFGQNSLGAGMEYNWIIADSMGNVVSYKKNSVVPFETSIGAWGGIFKYNEQINYFVEYNDTIFRIDPDFSNAVFGTFIQGEHRRPKKDPPFSLDLPILLTEYYSPRSFIETKNFLIHEYNFEKKFGYVFIRKTDNKTFVSFYQPDKDGANGGIVNNIDGGLSFRPKILYIKDSEEYLAGFFHPFQLKEYVSSDAFKNSTPKYPEKKKELEQLANSLDENDNPVLMLVKLKE